MPEETDFTSIEELRSRYYPGSVELITLDRREAVVFPNRLLEDALRAGLRSGRKASSQLGSATARTRKGTS